MVSNVRLSRLPVYMDYQATTPLDPRVLKTMLPYFTDCFGNAASVDHEYGATAAQAVETARQQVARALNAQHDEIIFTSGATEANNLAILGTAQHYANQGNHIITCVTEHKAVLDTCALLERQGWHVTYLPVDDQGLVDVDAVWRAIVPQTVLISIMAANNEIGSLAPLQAIGQLAHESGVLFHTDATQAVGHIPIDAQAMQIDLLSLSAHKFYGPKGIGALYIRKRQPRVRLEPQIHGGGHERGMRSGTLNVPGIIGLAEALELACREMEVEAPRLAALRDRLWHGLQDAIPDVELNGHPIQRLPHNLSVAISGVESRALVVQLKHSVAISSGSACTTAAVEPSHVILALGYGEARAHCSVRFSLGRETTSDDVEFAVQETVSAVKRLRLLSAAH